MNDIHVAILAGGSRLRPLSRQATLPAMTIVMADN